MPGTTRTIVSTPAKRARSASTKMSRLRKRMTKMPTVVSIGRQPFPKVLRNTCRYSDNFTISAPATGAPGYYVFIANGMFKPNNTGTGHQPMYFDQLMTIYDHYTVIGTKFTITPASGLTDTVTFGVFIDDENSPSVTGRSNAIERSAGGRGVWSTTGYVGALQPTLTLNWSANKAFGVQNVLTRDDLQGTNAANPSEYQGFIVWANNAVNAGASAAVYFEITMEFDVLWTDFRSPADS